ncbi:hypothetical protein GF376_03765 [Candidatus Peregrinibacteria bacterium]|nr:hypothetical protein [Candidatus Peregrinibacteria bacterium]
MLGFPSLNDLKASQTTQNLQLKNNYQPTENEQVINVLATEFEYILDGENTYQAEKPTKLIVQNKDAFGCAVALMVSGLMDDYHLLETGENVIDLGEPKAGTYKITCSMGMVQPISITFE